MRAGELLNVKVWWLRDREHRLPFEAQGLGWARPATKNTGAALVLWFGGCRVHLLLKAMMEYLANTTACALGNFARALGHADADVLPGDGAAFGDIAGGIEWVKRDKVAHTFPNALA
jgi:hypothetical protein